MKYEVQPIKKDVEKMKNMKNLEDNLMRVEGRFGNTMNIKLMNLPKLSTQSA